MNLLCRKDDVFVGFGAVGTVTPPPEKSADWLGAHCWICHRSEGEILAAQLAAAPFGSQAYDAIVWLAGVYVVGLPLALTADQAETLDQIHRATATRQDIGRQVEAALAHAVQQQQVIEMVPDSELHHSAEFVEAQPGETPGELVPEFVPVQPIEVADHNGDKREWVTDDTPEIR